MKAVILAGGLGTRLSEETHIRPKPMVEIGGKPILWHIMKIFDHYGINEFIICCGYKGGFIKEYFNNYHLRNTDIKFDLSDNSSTVIRNTEENWKVTCVDTGDDSLTGTRLKRVKEFLDPNDPFFLTYGDGVGDIDITSLIQFHKNHGKLATLTATRPPARYGLLKFGLNDSVKEFMEKPEDDNSWVNGGYFVLNPSVIDRIANDHTSWENDPLNSLANDGQLKAFKHYGYWQPMDTLREKIMLNELWDSGEAPWKVWK